MWWWDNIKHLMADPIGEQEKVQNEKKVLDIEIWGPEQESNYRRKSRIR